jgi:hypothetical protein
MGFKHVESGPLVRSSYHAQKQSGEYGAGGRSKTALIRIRTEHR